MLPNKSFQGVRVRLGPNRAALEAGVALSLKFRAACQGEPQETEVVWSKYDVGVKLLARTSDFSFRYFCPAAFETSGHGVKSVNDSSSATVAPAQRNLRRLQPERDVGLPANCQLTYELTSDETHSPILILASNVFLSRMTYP